MSNEPTKQDWTTTRIALKWLCRTTHEKWTKVGQGLLARGSERPNHLDAGKSVIEVHSNRSHKRIMLRCLEDDVIRFWDLVYKYWRERGPHDGLSRETIDLDEYRKDFE